MVARETVLLLDDDTTVRDAVTGLLSVMGYRVESYADPRELLKRTMPDSEHCLVLDVNLPGVDGLRLQERLARRETMTPIVFVTAHGDIPTTVRAMRAGAIDFLTKPFDMEALVAAIQRGIERSRALRQKAAASRAVRERYETLTPRQKEIMLRVTSGKLNKQVASDLGTSEITVKVHRRQVMLRMHAESLPDLVRMADRLGLHESAGR